MFDKTKLRFEPGSSLTIPGRGSFPFTCTVRGLPEGREARIINHGTEKHPNWHSYRRTKPDGELVENQTSHKTAQEAFDALLRELN